MIQRLLLLLATALAPAAQAPAIVDFQRDVQPILREHGIGCHGPELQMNGFRLDRRADAMRGATQTAATAWVTTALALAQ